jgi:hypothetical protein
MEGKTRLLFSSVTVQCAGISQAMDRSQTIRSFLRATYPDTVSGTSPSFAYVQLTDASRLNEAARNLHGQFLLGCAVRVSQVVPLHYAVA